MGFLELLSDSLIDVLKLLPFLYIVFLFMEWFEHKAGDRTKTIIKRSGPLGPVVGAAVGIIPQCGFSSIASNLYSAGIISVGTLLSVFLSTSDEMLPVFISGGMPLLSIIKFIFVKFIFAVVTGFLCQSVLAVINRKKKHEKEVHEICENEQCSCDDHGIFFSSLIHTLKIALFIFIFTFIFGLLLMLIGEDAIFSFVSAHEYAGIFFSALIGLVPNCGASVLIATFYVKGLLTTGQAIAGLLAGAGAGLLVLFRTNKNPKENLGFIFVLYVISIIWGFAVSILGINV